MDGITDYLQEKANKVTLQKLQAWKGFYEDNNNEWEATKIQRKIEKHERRY